MKASMVFQNEVKDFAIQMEENHNKFFFSPKAYTLLAKEKSGEERLVLMQFNSPSDYEALKATGVLSGYLIISSFMGAGQ